MAYRKDPREVVSFSDEELSHGWVVGKKVRVGIQVKDFTNGGRPGFLKEVSGLEQVLSQEYPSFGGVALHDLGSLVQSFGA